MAKYSIVAEDDVVMTDLEEREVYNTVSVDGSPQPPSIVTLPVEVWAMVINCKYALVYIQLYIITYVNLTSLSLV